MLKQLASLLLIAAAIPLAEAQYYGPTIFTEGFDADVFPGGWTQTNETEGNTTLWTLSDGEIASFSDIVTDNKRSARIDISGKDTRLTLTSPEIDATGREDIQAGFYGYELSYAFRGGVDFRFRASHDGGATWTDLFSATAGDSYTGKPVGQWNLYRYTLPEEFNGKKIVLQFYIDASTASGTPGGLAGYIDGIFLSLVPECDPEVTGINFSTNKLRPSSGVYGDNEKVTLTIRNSGTHELESTEVYFNVDNGDEVVETATFNPALQLGEQTTYTFTHGAELGTPRATMTITAGVRAEGDNDNSNNQIKGYATNLMADVPYVPFIEEEDGVVSYSTDEWTTFENNDEGYWDYDDWNGFYWYIEPEYASEEMDAWLVSRPVRFKAGNAYRLQFSASSEDDYGAANRMTVYIARDPDMTEGLVQIWSNDNIDDTNAMGQSAVFQISETAPYYIGFQCHSESGAALMRLEEVAIYKNVDKDVAVSALLSPQPGMYTYGNAEKVSATVYNFGAIPLNEGDAKIVVSLDGEDVLTENLPAMQPNTSLNYEFNGTLDLSRMGHPYRLTVKAALPGDEDNENNAIEQSIESTVASVPYIPDFGSQTAKGHDLSYWEALDRDRDGYTFSPRYDNALGAYAFSYGGGLYGYTSVTLPSSDDYLYSRPVALTGGKSYKLVFSSRVGKENATMPLAVNLCKVENGKRTQVAQILDTDVTTYHYTESINTFRVESDGFYELEFCVVNDTPVDYRISIGGVRLTELLGTDLSVEKIVLPTTCISNMKTFPVGVLIRNNGTETVDAFSLTATSRSIGKKTANFANGISIEPDQTYLVYFSEDFIFEGPDDETLTLAAETEGDGYTDNNSLDATMTFIDPIALPYKPLPEEAMTHTGAYNLNRDNFRFVPDRTLGTGYLFAADSPEANNDYVATPGLSMEKGKTMQVSFTYSVIEGDVSDLSVYAIDVTNDVRIPIADIHRAQQSSMSRFIGYLEVSADGVYNIVVQPGATSPSLFVSAPITVEEVAGRPDLKIAGLESHLTPTVLTDNETVTVNFTSESEYGLQSVPFELNTGDKNYYSLFTRYTSKNDGDSYRVTFEGVDLSEPGEYTVICNADVNADATPDNNTATFVIKSLPVVDIAVKSLVSPQSGVLTKEEHITVELENLGKGDLTGFTLACKVTKPDGTSALLTETVETPVATATTARHTFASTVDMYNEGVYTFEITATAEGDVNTDNNTLTVNINSTTKVFDAGVTEIINPVDAAHGQAVEVTIAVTNYGETALFNVPVSVEVAGPNDSEAQRIEGTVAEVEAGQTVEYTFPATLNLETCGDYILTASTNVTNDVDITNDKCVKTVRCLTMDVGVTAIISPTDGFHLGTCDVTVEVTNFGEASVSSIPMMYRIGTMPQLDEMEQVLEPGESATFTFSTPYEFTDLRTRNIVASTKLEKDADTSNDALEIEIKPFDSIEDAVISVGLSPNPTHGNIKISAPSTISSVEIYDMSGRLAGSFNGDGTPSLSLSLSLAQGNYIVKVVTAQGSATSTLIVK